jgi:RNA polymerase subunit RPABC4/transcription elongation factor Spt4
MAFCANCGTKIEEGIKFCSSCGKAVSGVSNELAAPIVQQQPAVMQAQPLMADAMYCSSCGAVIKKAAGICPKCGVKQSVAGKRNTLLLISAIIGSIFVVMLIIAGIAATFDFITNKDSHAQELIIMVPCAASPDAINGDSPSQGLMRFLPFITIILNIIATILTFIAWAQNKKSYALIGGILYIISIFGFVPAILNFVAYGQLKEQNKG